MYIGQSYLGYFIWVPKKFAFGLMLNCVLLNCLLTRIQWLTMLLLLGRSFSLLVCAGIVSGHWRFDSLHSRSLMVLNIMSLLQWPVCSLWNPPGGYALFKVIMGLVAVAGDHLHFDIRCYYLLWQRWLIGLWGRVAKCKLEKIWFAINIELENTKII